MIDQRLTGQDFQNTSRVYSPPRAHLRGRDNFVRMISPVYLASRWIQEAAVPGAPGGISGVGLDGRNPAVARESYFAAATPLRVDFSGGSSRIAQLSNGVERDSARDRAGTASQISSTARARSAAWCASMIYPPMLINAVLAAEDKRFFEHGALDLVRVFGAAFYDVSRSARRRARARSICRWRGRFFFTTKREWRRKVKEILMAAEIDERFSKQQIFELYANEIYLGNRGSFAIRGFGEAAQAYFGKDIRELKPRRSGLPGRDHPRAEPLFGGRAPPRSRHRSARPRPDADGGGWLHHRRCRRPRRRSQAAIRERRNREQRRALFRGHGEGPSARSNSRKAISKRRATASTPRSIPICSAPPQRPSQIGHGAGG